MQSKSVTFDHAVGDQVRIEANNLSGKVLGQWNGQDGVRYSVEYADANGRISDRWFRPEELTAAAA